MRFKNPVISIITPYYNGQDYIEETAKSVLNQTFQYFEWIIVDDGSSKEGLDKLKKIEKIDERIKVIWKKDSSKEFDKNIYQKEPTPTEKNRHQMKKADLPKQEI